MGYFEHLKEILMPLRLYDLDIGVGRAELAALGREMDRQDSMQETLELEMIPATASSYGLMAYEEIMPFVPVCDSTEERRAAIAALLRIDGGGFTQEALSSAVAGCGIGALVEESQIPETLTVTIVNSRGVPEDFAELKSRIEQILPCHLDVVYKFIYSTWNELMGLLTDWSELEAAKLSWRELEIYTEA